MENFPFVQFLKNKNSFAYKHTVVHCMLRSSEFHKFIPHIDIHWAFRVVLAKTYFDVFHVLSDPLLNNNCTLFGNSFLFALYIMTAVCTY